MDQISPTFGPPLMLIFVCLTNILLITSMISILSNSFAKVTARAREEYLYVYSVYVLEASTSNRLTHFYPPLNLIPLILIRPLRLLVSSENLRSIRILLLKATHTPIVGAIYIYERFHDRIYGTHHTFGVIGPATGNTRRVQRPFLSNRGSVQFTTPQIQRRLRRDSTKDSGKDSGSEQGLTKVWKTTVGQSASEEREDIQKRVDGLSTKIDELMALLMAQTKTSGIDQL
jgi:hypothetical protein